MNFPEIEGESFQERSLGKDGQDPEFDTESEDDLEESEHEVVDIDEEKPETSCQPSRFLLSFQDTTLLGDNCLDESRIKCRAFWTFIDANLQFKNIIKEGYYPSLPAKLPRYEACDQGRTAAPCSVSVPPPNKPLKELYNLSQEIRAVRVLPIEIKYRADEERRRFRIRRDAVKALQVKSGQPIVTTKRVPLKLHRCLYADEIPEMSYNT